MSDRIAIYISDVIGGQFDIAKEIAAREHEKGNHVHFVICDDVLRTCPAKNNLGENICILCKSKRKRGLKKSLEFPFETHSLNLTGRLERRESTSHAGFSTLEDLKSYSIDGYSFGMAIFSTIVSRTRNPYPSIERHRELTQDLVSMVENMYLELTDFIQSHDIKKVFVLNGRRASQAPAVFAAMNTGIDYATFEDGHSVKDHFICLDNMFVHDVEATKADIDAYWNDGTERAHKENVADQFYHDRRYGTSKDVPAKIFTEQHVSGMLPETLGSRLRTVVVFTSSEDEIAAEDLQNSIYKDQADGLNRILGDLECDTETEVIVRVHPNLKNVENDYMDALYRLDRYSNASFVRAESPVDTYALMERADIVLTFGSTMGIESAYFEKPSVLAGRAVYEDLDSCYRAHSHQEVVDLLRTRNLPARDPGGARKFGYYMIARDVPFEYVPHRRDSHSEYEPPGVGPSKVAYLQHSVKVDGLATTIYKKGRKLLSL